MLGLVDKKTEIEQIKADIAGKDCFVEIIPGNYYFHPKINNVVAIYIRNLNTQKSYILSAEHPDSYNLDKKSIEEILKLPNSILVSSRKDFLYYFIVPNVKDINFVFKYDYNFNDDPCIRYFYRNLGRNKDINKIIPLTVHLRSIESEFSRNKSKLQTKSNDSFDFFNKKVTSVFYLIEKTGLKVDRDKLISLFNVENLEFSFKESKVYSKFNLYNTTGRPTNSFNSINFSAIPKEGDYRKCFIPKNDTFLEFDFDGYHLRLIGSLVGYSFSEPSAHTELGKKYFNKENLTEEEYKEVKKINFQSIYGKIPSKALKLEFYVKLKQFIGELWNNFNSNGYIEDPISKKRFTKELEDITPEKLFNYLVQSYETSRNVKVLLETLRYTQNFKSKIVMYTYDAIVVDTDSTEKDTIIDIFKEILTESGKYPVKVRESLNLVFDS